MEEKENQYIFLFQITTCRWICALPYTLFSMAICLVLSIGHLGAQIEQASLEEKEWLSIYDGLAHNGVTSIFEDSRGYLWVGTYDGLNRYDGYGFKVFKNTVEKKYFISNRVRTINEDAQGRIWIGTDEGISIYNPDQEAFQNIYSNQFSNNQQIGPIVREIIFSEKHNVVLCATEGFGILVMSEDYQLVEQLIPPNQNDSQPILFHDGIALDDSNYLFSTSVGLLQLDLDKKQFTSVLESSIQFSRSIIKSGDGELLATGQNGVTIFTYSKNSDGYKFQFKENKYSSTYFISAAMDPLGNLWLGTNRNGFVQIKDYKYLNRSHNTEKQFYAKDQENHRISCFHFSQNSAWVGTFNKGMFRFDLGTNPFQHYHAAMNYPNGLKTNWIFSMSPMDMDRVYLVTRQGNIALFNTKNQSFEPLPFDLPAKYQNNISRIFVDSRQNTWLKHSGKNGFGRVKMGSTQFEEIQHPDFEAFDQLSVRHIINDEDGNIWIGGVEGAYKIVLSESGSIEKVISLNDHPFFKSNPIVNIRYMYEDVLHGFIWIGSHNKGLFRIKTVKGKSLQELKVDRYVFEEDNANSLPSNFVSFITRLPDDDLWVATESGGIVKVKNSDGEPEFITYSESQGLSNNVVKSILYDSGNMWIPTNIGLNKYNIAENRFRRFSKQDGLPFVDFEYANVKLDNGLLVLSGPDGFVYFDPAKLNVEEPLPRLAFGDLQLFNQNILPNDTLNGRVILEHSLNNTSEINLKHYENVFSIQIQSLHYSNPQSHQVQYQLLPINEDWVEIPSDQKEITYNGLPPGEYTFRARASNSINDWTLAKELSIIIDPPFWKTWLAYILYALLGISLIGFGVYIILRFQSLNHNLEIEKIEKNTIAKLNASKLRFFSNISHEIKTPIALISGPVNILVERFKGQPEVEDKLELIQRQTKNIIQLVDQVHGFQRADANALKLKKAHFSFDEFIDLLIMDFQFMANTEGKTLTVERTEQDIFVDADKDKLSKIFNNLLSNAFKYTRSGDSIKLKYAQNNGNIMVSVSDTGKGIQEDDLPHIFERFYQSPYNDTPVGGAGIGLAFTKKLIDLHFGFIKVISEWNKGSEFEVSLPVVSSRLSKDEAKREHLILEEEKKADADGPIDQTKELDELSLDNDFSETRIFFAEDNTDLRLFVSSVLDQYFQVVSFPDGKACLEALEDEWPDLLLSDVLMPELNGLELCRLVKSDIKTSHIPVVLLTACTSIEEQIQGLKVGADAYIQKPFDVKHLVLSIANLLKTRQKLRERFQVDNPLELEKSLHSNNDNIFLEKLYELMSANLDNQELELDSFVKELYLNRTHFFQKVKALTNQTPYELLKEYRLKKAAELLVQEKLTVSEVYTKTGFKSRTHFSKLFKEKYNVSPGKYGK